MPSEPHPDSHLNRLGLRRESKHSLKPSAPNPEPQARAAQVQKDIRLGHAQTVDKVLRWLDEGSVRGTTVCDAGCGTGSLAIPLALRVSSAPSTFQGGYGFCTLSLSWGT